MTLLILGAVVSGLVAGLTVIPANWLDYLDGPTTWSLTLLVFLVGISIGRNRDLPGMIRSAGLEMLAIPFSVIVGTLLGSLAAGALLGMPHNESMAVGAGFGWYTLSAVMLSQLHSPALGAVAFLSNVSRELMAVLLIPLLARTQGNLMAVAPGGATTMDTTLPIISKATDSRTTLVAFVNGVILSTLVPILVPLLLKG